MATDVKEGGSAECFQMSMAGVVGKEEQRDELEQVKLSVERKNFCRKEIPGKVI